ncbi:DnaB-like helicase N-terminal domain-containing protein [Nocardia sp. CNY236]|uniref:DnaB-like helicase N-terminal domain-containing protein n=1 Tax=Nocardia sp. CNY236 TaxID=1169152 RepID=UPI000414968B|nr:DnaB-like helicase N-terminal domain-containing protein [Nocardia sp. CNY236]
MMMSNPESHLLAALLNASADQAAEVLALVKDDDFVDERIKIFVGVIRRLAAEGRQPTPQAVSASTRKLKKQIQEVMSFERLSLFLAEIYTMGHPVRLWADACQVVKDSYRALYGTRGQRLAQMAEAYADIEDLEHALADGLRQGCTHRKRLNALDARAKGSSASTPTATVKREQRCGPGPPRWPCGCSCADRCQ